MKLGSLVLSTLLAAGTPVFAGVPVTAAPDQAALLASSDHALAANKRLVYDFWRVVLVGHHLDDAAKFLREDYIQHNPKVETGLKGFLAYFGPLGKPRPIPAEIPGLVSIRAEGDIVTLATVRELRDAKGAAYSTTWFDMFRVAAGKIAEHWGLRDD